MVTDHLYFHGIARTRPERARRHPATAPRVEEHYPEGAREFFRTLFEAAGVHPEGYRAKALNRRVPACLRHLGVKSLEEASDRLERHPELVPGTVSVSLLGVTEFFRDEPVFHQLGNLLPHLGKPLRIWSAACSEGQELYSMALLLESRGLLRDVELLGTDCRAQAIERARTAVYPPEHLKNMPAPWQAAYFQKTWAGMRLQGEIQQAARFRQADLLREAEPGPWNMILWRNMAIYLEPEAARHVWLRIYAQLAPGGIIVTGKAEHPPASLELERLGTCLYRKRITRS